MAAFPAITPSRRRYGFGLFPITAESGFTGSTIRFRHADRRYGVQLELGYEYLQRDEAQQIRDHYRGQDGGHRSFLLPNALWAGHTAPDQIVPLGTAWVYADEPSEDHRSGLLFDVGIRLVQVVSRL
jgi:hypothetical protein